MTNDEMTDLWELANDSFDDLKNTCKKRCKRMRLKINVFIWVFVLIL